MGLLDILNGMQHGLLALLATRAYKSLSNPQSAPSGQPRRSSADPSDGRARGLTGILRTILGGGSGSGGVLSRGIGNRIRDLEQQGHGDIARSWVGRGANRPITPEKLEGHLWRRQDWSAMSCSPR
jgi:uncharacterized protein YidB (DUF937 family)